MSFLLLPRVGLMYRLIDNTMSISASIMPHWFISSRRFEILPLYRLPERAITIATATF